MSAIWIIVGIAGVYLLFNAYLYIFQSHYIYFPERELSADPGSIGLDFENISFQTEDGIKLCGWFIPAEHARLVILFCHGNAGNISHRLASIQIFHQLGLDVFIFDYRGYGQSEGTPSEQGTYRDAEAAWQYLIEKWQVEPDQVIIFGRSLGGAVASWLAQEHKPGGLVVESAFTSLADIAAKLYPYLPVRLLLRSEYDTLEYVGIADCPVLVIHSRDDEMMPFSHGQRLFNAASEPKEFLEISGTHNEGFVTSGQHYQEGLEDFISEYLQTTD